jgi:nicotinamidase-related amidase
LISSGAYEFDPGRAAVLAIDFERDILVGDDGRLHDWAVPVVDGAARLVAWARELDIPTVWVTVERRADYADAGTSATDANQAGARRMPRRLVAGTAGVDIVDGLQAAESDYRVTKPRVSAYYATALEVYLRRLGVKTLLVGGVYTHMGVESTVRSAYDHDYDTIVVSDACGAPSQTLHEHAIGRVFPLIAMVRSTADLPGPVR